VIRSLRIALFSGNYNYLREGANQALNRLVGHLEASGHQVRVYSPVTDTPAFPPQGTLVPVPSVTLPIRTEFQLALGMPRAIRRDVEQFAPDLIHVSTPDILNSRAQTFARRRNIPIVASMHTRFDAYPAYYPGLRWMTPLARALQRRFYRRSDLVLAPTPALVEEMKRLRGDECAALWSRGVDRDLFNPSRRSKDWRRAQRWADDHVVVLFFGRLVLEKGVDTFVAAVQALRGSGFTVRPLIVGHGPAADRMRVLEGATFTGHLQGTDLARAIAGADIMVSPSTTEAFGNVVLEGMASGLAVISADAPSARALIDPGRTGLLCDPARPDEFAQAAARLMQSPDERRGIGAAARRESEKFTWDAASRAVEAAYDGLVAKRR
jgi:glycosyltransferase involved in cell wall biosynthesis